MVAAIFEAPMSREQADGLAKLMRDNLGQRAPEVLGAMLTWEPAPPTPPPEQLSAALGTGRLTAVWESEEAWERYRSSVDVPRAAEYMRMVGAEPTLTVMPVLEWL
jgi:hypothetical protein